MIKRKELRNYEFDIQITSHEIHLLHLSVKKQKLNNYTIHHTINGSNKKIQQY